MIAVSELDYGRLPEGAAGGFVLNDALNKRAISQQCCILVADISTCNILVHTGVSNGNTRYLTSYVIDRYMVKSLILSHSPPVVFTPNDVFRDIAPPPPPLGALPTRFCDAFGIPTGLAKSTSS